MTDQSVTKTSERRNVAVRRGRPRTAGLAAKRREEILATATHLFARDGFHEADMQQLADELGLAKGTLYRYFSTKRALFLAAVDRVMMLLHTRIEEVRAKARDPLRQIGEAIQTYLTFFDAHPEFVELLVLERAVFKDRKKPTYFEHRARNIKRWQRMYSDLITTGRVRRLSTESITDVLSSAVYGTMFTNFFAGRTKSPTAQARQIMDIVFHGLLTDKERLRKPELH